MDGSLTRVLLVDDDNDDFVIARDLLFDIDESGFKLDWVSTYDDGLNEILRNVHDVYLVDFRLGSNDGLQLVRDALEKGSKKPIILLTGQGDRDVDVEAMRAGASDYLVKGQIDAGLLEHVGYAPLIVSQIIQHGQVIVPDSLKCADGQFTCMNLLNVSEKRHYNSAQNLKLTCAMNL